ncbi:YoaK family protein [Mesorhizobium sp. YR577]|uniref:YoaK family protein n=1 Tax=Mesorhizobium sp. YR577 TaxID=1884373 RepID=UPI0008EADCD3|nr:YoaK family protein [Mesorhizobium sp. YR577]SFU22897.1 Uncharacterized membrane protein YoaK, UPF0700 family [Mesorhizobium sp. YR577]
MKNPLATLLSFIGGYVDTAGFLALNGLFTAHVTGNFVMIGAAIAHDSSGILSKLLALPVFCVAILIARTVSLRISMSGKRTMVTMLCVQFLLLSAAAALAIHFGKFDNPDGLPLITTGMLIVAAMAIQNGFHRVRLNGAPPTTLMTGTTTQIMLDVAALLSPKAGVDSAPIKSGVVRLAIAVATFALGCALAALTYIQLGMWCFVLPPILTLIGISIQVRANA